MMPIDDISRIEGLYKDEWLLFEVTETDEMNRPLKGRLIMHNPNRDLVEKKAIEIGTTIKHGYLTYTGEPLPTGVEAAL